MSLPNYNNGNGTGGQRGKLVHMPGTSPNAPTSVVRLRTRATTSHSVLQNPESPIHSIAYAFQEYVHLPDPMPLYVLMGTVAANMLTGNPVWLMMVGSSGSGKTMLLKSVMKLERMRAVSSIKGEAALISGVKKKDRAKDATGGLLCELGDNGCLVFMDFTSVLSKSKEAVNELLGDLRELYDGTWSRDIGGEGGRHMEHKGRVCLLAGVTHAIDRHYEVGGEMGQRCLYYRFPYTDGYQESMQAANNVDPSGNTDKTQDLVSALFSGVGLSMTKLTERRVLEPEIVDQIVNIAQVGARARSSVPRDYTRQVIDVPDMEVATRLSAQLAQLWLGMEVIGVLEEEIWQAIRKVSLDSMPLGRRVVLRAIEEGVGRTAQIARKMRISEGVARRILEDLSLLGLVKKSGEEWGISEWAEARKVGFL